MPSADGCGVVGGKDTKLSDYHVSGNTIVKFSLHLLEKDWGEKV